MSMFQSFRRVLMAASFIVLSAFAGTAAMAAVDVNKADQAALETVKGIGPGLSTKLLDERKKGAFKDWADLIERVQGIGHGNAARFSTAGLTVNSAPYAAGAAKPVDKTVDKAKAAVK